MATEQTPLIQKPLQNPLHGYIFLFTSSLLYPIVALLTRYRTFTRSYPVLTALLLRSIISTALTTPFLPFLPRPSLTLSKKDVTHLLTASIVGASSFLFMCYALFYAPLATVVTVKSVTTPLTAFVCAIFLGEGVQATEIGALATSTFGVLLISQPSNDFGESNTPLGIILAILSTITAAIWGTLLRKMGDVHALLRVITLFLFVGLETALFARSAHWKAIFAFPNDTLIVSGASVLSLIAMLLLNSGMKRCRSGSGLLLMTMSVPFSFALGWLFLGESAEWFTLVGAVLVIGSAAVIALQAVGDDEDDV